MSLVNVINVIVLNPKATYSDKISFEIFFEALQPLQHSKSSLTNSKKSPILQIISTIKHFYEMYVGSIWLQISSDNYNYTF